jgi:hypothetical protein
MIKPIEITDRLDDLCSRIGTKIPPIILSRKNLSIEKNGRGEGTYLDFMKIC